MGRELDFNDMWASARPMISFREPRYSIIMQATLSCGDGAAASARVRNISRGGMMAQCRFRGNAGDQVLIYMRGLGEVGGNVVWTNDNRIGVMFDEPIDPAAALRRRHPAARQEMQTPRIAERAWRPPLSIA